jgi:subtilase family serine protease
MVSHPTHIAMSVAVTLKCAAAQTTWGRAAMLKVLRIMTLQLRDEIQLDTLLQRLYDPTSPDYRHFLSVEEFTAQFGPTAADYSTVLNYAASHGLTVTSHHANRLVVEVEGTVADMEKAFHVSMQTYQHPTENRTYFAPDVEPSVDAGVAVAGISGLNNYITPRPMSLRHADFNQVQPNATGSLGDQVTMATLDVQPTPLPEARNRLTVSVSLWTSA